MRRGLYFLSRAIRGIRQAGYVNAVSVLTIAISLFVVAIFATAVGEVRAGLRTWGQDMDIAVYLTPGLAPARAEALARRIGETLGAGPEAVRVVTPAEGLERLKASLGSHAEVLDLLEDNPLPAVLEVPRGERLAGREAAAAFARAVGGWEGVDEVDWGREWAERLEHLVDLVALAGWILGGLILAAAAVTVGNTIKLAVYARRDEIEIMKLCGATDAFVRTPFLLEGMLQGVAGAVVASTLVVGLWALLAPQAQVALAETLALRLELGLPTGAIPWLLGGGALMGLGGSALSLGRYLEV